MPREFATELRQHVTRPIASHQHRLALFPDVKGIQQKQRRQRSPGGDPAAE
jgi:hypothetical protein